MRKMLGIVAIVIIVIFIGMGLIFLKKMSEGVTITYKDDNEAYVNPLMGYAPSATSSSLAERYSLVYVNLLWSELEPEEGVFDWQTIEDKYSLPRWKDEGKKLVLRFVCDLPSSEEHMDIPQWLYDKTGDGEFYNIEYGKGYCPNYNNKTFIEEHAKAIKEIGNHFSQDDFLAYVELGSLGHWGEWHTYYPAGIPRIPKTSVREEYVEHYVDAFPYAKLLMRRPFSELPDGAGVFNDMVGHDQDTFVWLQWIKEGGDYDSTGEEGAIVAKPDIWNTAPVGGEFTSSIPMKNMLGINKAVTLSMIDNSHMTFIGPKIPDVKENESLLEASNEVLTHIGYRYMVSSLNIKRVSSKEMALQITMKNNGAAPIYYDWTPCIYIGSSESDYTEMTRYELDIDLTKLTAGKEITTTLRVPVSEIEESGKGIYAGIENPVTKEPSVYLTMKGERMGTLSLLWKN